MRVSANAKNREPLGELLILQLPFPKSGKTPFSPLFSFFRSFISF